MEIWLYLKEEENQNGWKRGWRWATSYKYLNELIELKINERLRDDAQSERKEWVF